MGIDEKIAIIKRAKFYRRGTPFRPIEAANHIRCATDLVTNALNKMIREGDLERVEVGRYYQYYKPGQKLNSRPWRTVSNAELGITHLATGEAV